MNSIISYYTCEKNKFFFCPHQQLTFTATCYLPPYTPHMVPLDPVTFKQAPPPFFTGYTGPLDPQFDYPKS